MNRYDGRSGVWSTLPRRKKLGTNANRAVFLDRGVLAGTADTALPATLLITEDGLALRSVRVPDATLPALRKYLTDTGQPDFAEKVEYATGQISTADTWSQTYGYFEIEARIPEGKGRWPAFWLAHAGLGWPPEIDVFEAYGRGITRPTNKDNLFHTSVHFDMLDAELEPTHAVDIENPYVIEDGAHQRPERRGDENGGRYAFHRASDASERFDADIYGGFHTYAAMWTPDSITFYFGKDRESLKEVYKTITPPDVNEPMYLIANDQFTARGGWWEPDKSVLDQTIAPENAFQVRQITIRALLPELEIDMAAGESPRDDRDSLIRDTAGDDLIDPGQGFDLIDLSGGADTLVLERGRSNKVVSGFGADDRLILQGFPFDGAKDLMSRLTQVGDDVWLPSGAYPADPQTIVFRDSRVADFLPEQFETRWSVTPDVWAADAQLPGEPVRATSRGQVLVASERGSKLTDGKIAVRMEGGPGGDIFVVSNKATHITEPVDAGVDTVVAYVGFRIPDNVERGIAAGTGMILEGTDGNDRLEARGKRTVLVGGPGDDLFVLDPSATSTLALAAGDGFDRVRGWKAVDRIDLSPDLLAQRSEWTLQSVDEGVRLQFSDRQGIVFEGAALHDIQNAIGGM